MTKRKKNMAKDKRAREWGDTDIQLKRRKGKDRERKEMYKERVGKYGKRERT
jgi:hypothetical protein